MWTTEAFDNEILLYYSIFPHGLSLKNKGELKTFAIKLREFLTTGLAL